MGSAPNGANNGNASKEKHSKVKAAPADVLVLSYGSNALRYGRAVDPTPKKVAALVAFRRRPGATHKPLRPVWMKARCDDDAFERVKNDIVQALDMDSRRVGGGRPVPWDVEIEAVEVEVNGTKENYPVGADVLVGRDAHAVLAGDDADDYDVVAPLWDGKLVFGTGPADTLVRAAIDALLAHIATQITPPQPVANGVANGDTSSDANGNGKKTSNYIALVIPDTSDRRDVAEFVDALFRLPRLRAEAVFIHQSSVSCALGAGLATCTVVDIGHSATTVACVEDGSISADSRVRLGYGAWQMHAVFRRLLQRPELSSSVTAKVLDQVCSLHIKENDRLFLATAQALRIKVGLALRTLPAHGLFYPDLLTSAASISLPRRAPHQRHNADDNFLDTLHADVKRNAAASAAVPIGTFANEKRNSDLSITAPLVKAIVWAAEHASSTTPAGRLLSAVVLSGGGASIDRIALKLEAAIKDEAKDKSLPINNVTVIDGGKGKGDEELAAANAILQGAALIPAGDDTDTASLPWKGCAVMVEADAVKDYWFTKKEWLQRNVRVIRERVPFYW